MISEQARKLLIKNELAHLEKHAEKFSNAGARVISHFKYMQEMVERIFEDVQEEKYELLKEYSIFLYRSGISKDSLCKILNIKHKELSIHLGLVSKVSCRDKYTFVDEVVELYLKNTTQSSISRKFNLSESTIREILKEEGIHIQFKKGSLRRKTNLLEHVEFWPKEKIKDRFPFIYKIVDLYLNGASQNSLSRKFNLTNQIVRDLLKNRGVYIARRNATLYHKTRVPKSVNAEVPKSVNPIFIMEETPEIKKPIKKPVINKINNILYKRLEHEWINK